MITGTLIRHTFHPEDIHDGAIDYRTETIDSIQFESRSDLASWVQEVGLTFNGSWFDNPDGSRIVDYVTGEREEISLHLDDEADYPGE